MNISISLCMIVKNEEDVIERCLQSVQNLVDEIVVVDTGSTDRTIDIVSQYTDKIYKFEWTNDFAAARNAGLRKATGQWILVLDADEYVMDEDVDKLKRHLAGLDPQKQQGVELTIYNLLGGGHIVESTAMRLFLNSEDIYYVSPIHEQVRRHGKPFISQQFTDFPIYHTGYMPEVVQRKQKSKRNTAILEELRARKTLTPYEAFTLGNEYMSQHKFAEAAEQYEYAYRADGTNRWDIHCAYSFVQALFNSGAHAKAMRYTEEAIKRWPGYTDFYFIKGMFLKELGLENEAIRLFKKCLHMSESAGSQKFWVIYPDTGTTRPALSLYEIYSDHLQLNHAVHFLTKYLQYNRHDTKMLARLIAHLLEGEPLPRVAGFLQKLYPPEDPQNGMKLLMASLLLGHRELADRYFSTLSKEQLAQMPASIMSRYRLVQGNRPQFDEAIAGLPDPDDGRNRLLYLAACIWQDEKYLQTLNPEGKHYSEEIVQFIQALSQGRETDSEIKDATEWVALCSELFQLGHYETYDQVIRSLPAQNQIVVAGLADFFYKERQFGLAVDYYSVLFNRNQLHAEGYLNLARLYIAQGEIEEAVSFLKQAVELNPKNILGYTLILQHSPNPADRLKYKTLLHERLPESSSIELFERL